MIVVRPPSIIGTPRQLATDLGARLRKYPNPRRPDRTFDYRRDFFMMPINREHVRNGTPEYAEAITFAHRHKLGQRQYLRSASIPCPAVAGDYTGANALAGGNYVVRPLRHSRSVGYRVTSDRFGFAPGAEYISELYPKRREYRVIFVFGQPLIYLRKKPNEGVDDTAPWGHLNSRFQTINDVPACRLSATDCVSRLSACAVVRGAHIVAADILYNGKQTPSYAVLELNFCPSLEIDNNRARVVEVIRGRM